MFFRNNLKKAKFLAFQKVQIGVRVIHLTVICIQRKFLGSREPLKTKLPEPSSKHTVPSVPVTGARQLKLVRTKNANCLTNSGA